MLFNLWHYTDNASCQKKTEAKHKHKVPDDGQNYYGFKLKISTESDVYETQNNNIYYSTFILF